MSTNIDITRHFLGVRVRNAGACRLRRDFLDVLNGHAKPWSAERNVQKSRLLSIVVVSQLVRRFPRSIRSTVRMRRSWFSFSSYWSNPQALALASFSDFRREDTARTVAISAVASVLCECPTIHDRHFDVEDNEVEPTFRQRLQSVLSMTQS